MTAPLPGAPCIITPAMRAADDAYRDQLAAQTAQALADAAKGEREASERIHNRTPWWLKS